MTRTGVVTGSLAEARCLPDDGRFLVRCSGADAARAADHAEALIAAGVDGLLSFGLAGGLDPALCPGDLLLPEVVLRPPGAGEGEFRPASDWRAEMENRLAGADPAHAGGALVGSDTAVMTPEDKRMLQSATGALAVDMESHIVAEAAARAGVPFLVVRAIADPAAATLPVAALAALRPDGSTDLRALLRRLIGDPSEIAALLRLARDARRGLRALRRVARSL